MEAMRWDDVDVHKAEEIARWFKAPIFERVIMPLLVGEQEGLESQLAMLARETGQQIEAAAIAGEIHGLARFAYLNNRAHEIIEESRK